LFSKAERAVLHPAFPFVTLALAILVRLVWITVIDTQPVSDFRWYFQQGLRIAEGRGYSVDHDGFPLWSDGAPLATARPTAFWPVGYAGFLGVLFFATPTGISALFAAKLANVAFQIGAALLTAWVAGNVFGSKQVARVTLLLVALSPNAIAYSALTATESYFTFLICAGVALLVYVTGDAPSALRKTIGLLAAGAAFGLATLTKPQAGFLPVVVLLTLPNVGWKRTLGHAALVYAMLAAIVVPWTIRNTLAFGVPVAISTNGWVNLLIGNLPGSWGKAGVMWNDELQHIIDVHHDELAWNSAAKEVVLRYVHEHPLKVLTSVPGKVFALLSTDVDGFGWNLAGSSKYEHARFWLPLRLLSQAYYLLGLAAFVGFCVRFARGQLPRSEWLAPAVVLYFTLIYAVFFGGPRFHYPFVPWIYACAAAQLCALAALARSAPREGEAEAAA
jgi:4-amino-4-deoxy-L-arabinose transferase-like glycosyltransferase